MRGVSPPQNPHGLGHVEASGSAAAPLARRVRRAGALASGTALVASGSSVGGPSDGSCRAGSAATGGATSCSPGAGASSGETAGASATSASATGASATGASAATTAGSTSAEAPTGSAVCGIGAAAPGAVANWGGSGASPAITGGGLVGATPGAPAAAAPMGAGSGRSNSRRGRSSRRCARWSGRGLWIAQTIRPLMMAREGCFTLRPQTSQRAIYLPSTLRANFWACPER